MIKVLIVDDSVLVRKVLTVALSHYDDITVVGTAEDAYVAREQIIALNPDVITLDIEMPRMDGLSFLETLMTNYPLPVIIVSSLSPRNSDAAIRALSLGAVDVIAKPGSAASVPDVSLQLAASIRAAARARLQGCARPVRLATTAARSVPQTAPRTAAQTAPRHREARLTRTVIALGASTGGTQALEAVLTRLPATMPGIVVCQHLPEKFTASFAKRLNALCALEVREACDGEVVAPGVALIAPGNRHLRLTKAGSQYAVRVDDGPRVRHQRPAVDVLFSSVAECAGYDAIAALLTGMGVDGAQGMLQLRTAGAHTIAQDEASCIVFGMPREAIRLGGVVEVLPLCDIADALQLAVARGRLTAV